MKTEYTGTFINGGVSFDTPTNLPENTRVVVIVPEKEGAAQEKSQLNPSQREALLNFLELSKKLAKPLHEHHYTRDELYDRY